MSQLLQNFHSIQISSCWRQYFIILSLAFFITDLCFLIPAVIAKFCNSTAELAIPTGTPTNEANAEIETQPLTAEKKTR